LHRCHRSGTGNGNDKNNGNGKNKNNGNGNGKNKSNGNGKSKSNGKIQGSLHSGFASGRDDVLLW